MKHVSVGRLKRRLNEYLRLAGEGEAIVIMNRRQPIAVLGPPNGEANDPACPEGLVALVRRGVLRLPTNRGPFSYPVIKPRASPLRSIDMLDESRGSR